MTALGTVARTMAFMGLSFGFVIARAYAMPQTIDYQCTPAWPEGDTLTIDWNSGHKSITAQFPNGSEMNMAVEHGGSSFRYGEADTEIYGRSQDKVMVREGGEPLRTCVAQ